MLMHRQMKLFTRLVVFLYVLSAGVTWVAGEVGEGLLGRVTAADLLALVLIGLFALQVLVKRSPHFKLPLEFRAYLPLLIVFFFGVMFSHAPDLGGIELIIHCFGFLTAVAMYNLLLSESPEDAPRLMLTFMLWAGGILAGVGLVDFLIWPELLPDNVQDGLSGTFRNTGQAGAFYGIYLAVLVPAVLSGMLSARPRNVAILLVLLAALMFTSKRAAVIGFGFGLVLLSISLLASKSSRDKRIGVGLFGAAVFVVPLLYLAFVWGLENADGMAWRFSRKFNSDVAGDFQAGFLADNVSVTSAALFDNPIVGAGLGNIVGSYSDEYEIHSTYLAILGTSGVLGAFAYMIFIVMYLRRIVGSVGSSAEGLYLRYFLPMLIGLLVSWSYTYHLRKREFWVMFVVTSLVMACVVSRRKLRGGRAAGKLSTHELQSVEGSESMVGA